MSGDLPSVPRAAWAVAADPELIAVLHELLDEPQENRSASRSPGRDDAGVEPGARDGPEAGEKESCWFVADDHRGQMVDGVNVSECSGG